MDQDDQETLIALTRHGDKRAFQQLYQNYYEVLFGIINRIIRDPDEAEDLLQDTYLKAWQQFHQYDSTQARLSTWLFTIAKNTAIDALRKRDRVLFTSVVCR